MPKRRVLTHERFKRPPALDGAQRELNAIREIAHALVHADRPEEVFQFALDRTGALIGAAFASVYVLEGVSELMRLAAASNWPEQHRPWLSEMRVRIGFGPSGEAAAERRAIEVPDVLADPGLEDWAEVARELGFRSLVALPLQNATGTLGAVTFYFTDPGPPGEDRRTLMRLVADQLAAAAEKARMVSDLRRLGAALADARDQLDRTIPSVSGDRGATQATPITSEAAAQLAAPLWAAAAALDGEGETRLEAARREVERALALLEDLGEYLATRSAGVTLTLAPCSTHEVVQEASRLADAWVGAKGIPVLVRSEASLPVTTDRGTITRLLASLLVFADTRAPGTTPVVHVVADGDRVRLTVQDAGPDLTRAEVERLFEPLASPGVRVRSQAGLALARALAVAAGGELDAMASPGRGLQLTISLPLTTSLT